MNSKNDFLKQLDQMDNEGKLEKNPDRLINWHKARATICLYDEAYQLRLALNRTAEAMEFLILLKDIVIGPGKKIDPSSATPENEVIALIKKAYGFLAETMEVSIQEGMVRIKFKDATPEKISEAQAKLEKAIKEAQQGRLLKALKLFQEVLMVIPEHVDARRNLAKIYLDLGSLDKAKRHLTECLQIGMWLSTMPMTPRKFTPGAGPWPGSPAIGAPSTNWPGNAWLGSNSSIPMG